ncbi:hypothetical protein FDC58_09355 [Clostridium botulinum]|nr:hypothetical protein U728_2833 [Clostridium botulinum 202F]KFX55130.1 hypothetical protein KU40_11125 [Clostridium botulinum]KFX56475.1 hypothetical protein KU41_14200 [Clostridium botulinum]KON11788.1 hypothetical protein ACP50_15995 [Clostridium botulinum]MBN1066659.1 hypothetical protein [Clostridium botulinum]
MRKKVIYVDFIKKRKINFFTFIFNRLISYIHVKFSSEFLDNNYLNDDNNNTKIDYYKFK